MLNILAAKRAGADDETIARAIAEIYNKDYDELASQGVTPETLIQASMEIEGQDMSTWDSFLAGASAEVGSELTGIQQIVTGEIDAEDTAKENVARISSETNPIATGLGRFIGGIVNPSTLLPGSMVFKGAKGLVTAGAAGGAVAGGLRPIFVEEEELGRAGSAALGAGAGAALGGLLGKLFGPKAVKAADELTDTPTVNTASVEAGDQVTKDIEAIDPPITQDEIANYLQIVSKIDPNIDPTKLNEVVALREKIASGETLSPYEQTTLAELSKLTDSDIKFLVDFNNKANSLQVTEDGAKIFDIENKLSLGEEITPYERSFLQEFMNDPNKSLFDLTSKKKVSGVEGQPPIKTAEKAAADATIKQANDKAAAQVEPGSTGQVARSMSSFEEEAIKTGNYLDYFTNVQWKLSRMSPKMFDRMIDPENPFAKQNIKALLAETEKNQELFSQVYGAIGKGKMKYLRQEGKKFTDILEENLVPEEVAIKEILSRKLQQIIEPEAVAPTLNYVSQKINDLHSLRDLARVAKERGSEDAYAVLSSEMTHIAGLLSSLEGNASNIGRALAFQKTIKQVVNANKELPGYLGGFGC